MQFMKNLQTSLQTHRFNGNPAAFREFAKLIANAGGCAMRATLSDNTYTTLNVRANGTTGSITGRQSVSANPNQNYAYDACQIPWYCDREFTGFISFSHNVLKIRAVVFVFP
jgi:hypothetical protein